jgi:protein TonB
MTCLATAAGKLTECSVTSEAPGDMGFASAALSAAHLFKMKPERQTGQSVTGARTTVTLKFQLDQ